MLERIDPYQLAGGEWELMRQSMLGQADVCLMRVEFDRMYGGTWSEPRVLGTAYHAGTAYAYRNHDEPFIDKDAMRAQVIDAFAVEISKAAEASFVIPWDKFGSESGALQKAIDLANLYVDRHMLNHELYEVIAVEVPFWWPLGGRWIAHGTIDLVVRDRRDGTHWIIDHKTSGRPWKKGKESARAQNQPGWYLGFWPVMWATMTGEALPITQFAFHVMQYDGKYDVKLASRNQAEIQRAFELATMLATLIDKDGPFFPNRSHFLCDERWCDHWQRCKFGAGMSTISPLLQITGAQPVHGLDYDEPDDTTKEPA